MQNYEIEIKSLLGSKEKADDLIQKMSKDPSFQSKGSHKQLNHYFADGNLPDLFETVAMYLSKEKTEEFIKLVRYTRNFSVRTRWADGKVILVVKATVDDTTSSNGTARLEFEAEFKNLSLEQLDQIVLDSKFKYQAKWSRERQDYKFKDLNVSIDKNAGYGYLAEFEKQIEDPTAAEETKNLIRDKMMELGIEELPQERLERMFAYYNQNWKDYYGTEKTFIID